MSPDSVAMDIIFVRVPLGDAEMNGKMWDEIDEQHFPAELRQRLLNSGFRVGLIGNQVPRPLAKLLELNDKPPSARRPCSRPCAADTEETNHPIGGTCKCRPAIATKSSPPASTSNCPC